MSPKQKYRLFFACSVFTCVVCVTVLVTQALREQVNLFLTPSEILSREMRPGSRVRIGGLVKADSVQKTAPLAVAFTITDLSQDIPVVYQGMLPDLFKEKQGVVVSGVWQKSGTFQADEVLAKHDENYTPIKGLKDDR